MLTQEHRCPFCQLKSSKQQDLDNHIRNRHPKRYRKWKNNADRVVQNQSLTTPAPAPVPAAAPSPGAESSPKPRLGFEAYLGRIGMALVGLVGAAAGAWQLRPVSSLEVRKEFKVNPLMPGDTIHYINIKNGGLVPVEVDASCYEDYYRIRHFSKDSDKPLVKDLAFNVAELSNKNLYRTTTSLSPGQTSDIPCHATTLVTAKVRTVQPKLEVEYTTGAAESNPGVSSGKTLAPVAESGITVMLTEKVPYLPTKWKRAECFTANRLFEGGAPITPGETLPTPSLKDIVWVARACSGIVPPVRGENTRYNTRCSDCNP